jgi:HSP20 family molecular chaperone IbpA
MSNDNDDDDERKDLAERKWSPSDIIGFSDLERFFRSMARFPMDWARGLEDGFRTPLSEMHVDEETGNTVITVEIPGIDKKDIDVTVTEHDITIKAETENRKYKRSYSFSKKHDPLKAKASFNNGVLELVLIPIETKEAKKHKIKVD